MHVKDKHSSLLPKSMGVFHQNVSLSWSILSFIHTGDGPLAEMQKLVVIAVLALAPWVPRQQIHLPLQLVMLPKVPRQVLAFLPMAHLKYLSSFGSMITYKTVSISTLTAQRVMVSASLPFLPMTHIKYLGLLAG
jgi:hypothetical protein